jgi:hypothetical protein
MGPFFDILLSALQVDFFDHGCHGRTLGFEIDLPDGSIHDFFYLPGKPTGPSIRPPFAKKDGQTPSTVVIFYPSVDCYGMLAQGPCGSPDVSQRPLSMVHCEERLKSLKSPYRILPVFL